MTSTKLKSNTCVMSFISLLTTNVLCRLYLYLQHVFYVVYISTYNKNGLMYRVVCRIVTGTN